MTTDRQLTLEELRTAEAVILSEKLALMIQILYRDATDLAQAAIDLAHDRIFTDSENNAADLANFAVDLVAKISAMRADIGPLLEDVTARHAQAQKDRSQAACH